MEMGGIHVIGVLEELELWRGALEESSHICSWQRKNKENNYPQPLSPLVFEPSADPSYL